MKIIGIVGSAAEKSYNRLLLKDMQRRFKEVAAIELIEIKELPMFNQDDDQSNGSQLKIIIDKIDYADGVIIATPEHNHTIPAALKSLLEWLSFTVHPLENKPVMIVGASYYDQGSSRAQLHLRQILDAPGVNAMVMPGNEFLLGKAKEAFDSEYHLKDSGTVQFLTEVFKNFIKFIDVVSILARPKKMPLEDLYAEGAIDSTIQDIDMTADDWFEKASEKVNAVSGDTYVKLNRGILTVDQLNYFFNSMPMELTFADNNNQFLYYNFTKENTDMLAPRVPEQVGNPLAYCHPQKSFKNVEWVIQQLRSGKQDVVRVHIPKEVPQKFIVHNYQAMHDENGKYAGINEYILDFKPIVDWYLKQTNQSLEKNENNTEVDTVSSASVKEEVIDAVSSASVH